MVKKRTKNRTQDKRTKNKSTKDKVHMENSRRTADWNLEVRGQKERKARG